MSYSQNFRGALLAMAACTWAMSAPLAGLAVPVGSFQKLGEFTDTKVTDGDRETGKNRGDNSASSAAKNEAGAQAADKVSKGSVKVNKSSKNSRKTGSDKKTKSDQVEPEDTVERVEVATPKPLTVAEQNELLKSRNGFGLLGNFNSMASLLYATAGVFIHCSPVEVGKCQVLSVFPASYKATMAELFESMARQTGTTFKYNDQGGFWDFQPPAMPLPYKVTVPPSWKQEERGGYVAYIPAVAPVGMDIYMMGRYSGLDKAQSHKAVEELSMMFAGTVNAAATTKDLVACTVDGVDGLKYETSSVKRPDTGWHQWAFIKDGQAFLIVSTIDKKNESTVWPDVQSMVASFKLVAAPSCPGI